MVGYAPPVTFAVAALTTDDGGAKDAAPGNAEETESSAQTDNTVESDSATEAAARIAPANGNPRAEAGVLVMARGSRTGTGTRNSE